MTILNYETGIANAVINALFESGKTLSEATGIEQTNHQAIIDRFVIERAAKQSIVDQGRGFNVAEAEACDVALTQLGAWAVTNLS